MTEHEVDRFFEQINIYDGVGAFFSSIADVPIRIVNLYAAHFCLSEVRNGGLLQLFYNSTGVLAPEAVEGYRQIGMPQLAHLFSQAIERLGSPYPREREERWDALLAASCVDSVKLKLIFESAKTFFHGYRAATLPLQLDSLDEQIWRTAESENGGFEERAKVYAESC